jgi:hypothetical protein
MACVYMCVCVFMCGLGVGLTPLPFPPVAVLHAKELQRRYGDRGLTAFSVHPGVIMDTNLMNHGAGSLSHTLGMLMYPRAWLLFGGMKSVPQGAATTVFAAMAPVDGGGKAGAVNPLRGGSYLADCAAVTDRVHPLADDADLASRLWAASEAMVNKALAGGK